MATSYEISKFAGASMEDVLLKLYPVAVLKWLYDVNLRNLAETCAATLPQPDRQKPSDQDKAPKKAYLIQLLLAVFQDQAIGRQFFESLPQETRQVIAALTWARGENLAALEKTLGQQIAMPNPDERRSYYEPFLLPPEHGFVVIVKKDENYWSYSSTLEKAKKEDYFLLLPDTVRKTFKAFVSPPSGYELLPLDDVPSAGAERYSCAHKVIADLRLVAEYIAQGHLTEETVVYKTLYQALYTVKSGVSSCFL